ncbi:MAG: hypothetical protein AM325_013845 [Candidatus Thorarchaeota archaeon SMTZ1-45]|nr:MAG: hypothetical protein AM325_15365 [Candidatus Thorarchaeota archaeon SMTZ1-45]
MKMKGMKIPIVAALLMTLLVLSLGTATTNARPPDTKMVDTVVGSFSIDGTTVYYVSHITGIMRWIEEPSDYVEWNNEMIPVDGKIRVVSSSLQHETTFQDDNRVSMSTVGNKYVGTLEIIPVSSEFPIPLPPFMPVPKDGQMNVHYIIKNFGEKGAYKYHAVIKYDDFVPRIIKEKYLPPPKPQPPQQATYLTGVVQDSGIDTDGDSKYDYLEVSVGVAVATAGTYTVTVDGLMDESRNRIDVGETYSGYLNRGTQYVDIRLYGPTIYAHGYNPSMISVIFLFDDNYNWLDIKTDVPLTGVYFYTDFDTPPAVLTGTIYDEGVDADDVVGFDYLEIGVEVEVYEAGIYGVELYGLLDEYDNHIYDAWDKEFQHLEEGTHVVSLQLNGPSIYISGISPSAVNMIGVRNEQNLLLGLMDRVALSRTYDYTEFEAPGAYLAGLVTCEGVDTDDPPNGLFDYLVIGVAVMQTQQGVYFVEISGLFDEEGNIIPVWSQGITCSLLPGLEIVPLYIDGSLIYMFGLNPRSVSLSLYDSEHNFIGGIYDIPLPTLYDYTQFEPRF